MKQNILISGTGGQGIVAAGAFLGQALFAQGLEVMFSRSYGASARGGACKSEVMVSDGLINDLQFEDTDVLMCLSLPAFLKYLPTAKPGSLVIVDSHVYERAGEVRDDVEIVQIPARDMAVGLGNQIVANMVMLGNLAGHSEVVSLDLLKEAVMTRMKESMRGINIKALESGFNF
ncbi:2-oxoacid:acceptor oxidoreductase family protein [Candidatus Bathyarchaeota archaeon]|nr:2-oxoacid:acceptor oxidoreductase family protein [Candidatus Bathyarchaeota archaeon]